MAEINNSPWSTYEIYPHNLTTGGIHRYDAAFHCQRLKGDGSRLFTAPDKIDVGVIDVQKDGKFVEGGSNCP